MKVSMIVAAAHNGVIGCNNELPWYLPEDLKYFKSKTIGKPVIMGRKTYDSIGKPLPNRINIIVTRDKRLSIPGVRMACSVTEALVLAEEACEELNVDEAMIIGGEQIYRLMLDVTDRVYLTEVDMTVSGDAHFPPLDSVIWKEVSSHHPKQAQDALRCCFKVYEKCIES